MRSPCPTLAKWTAILLDISETGMDVLTAEAQVSGALLAFRFQLPDARSEIEGHGQVAWANPNGQTGVHFLDVSELSVSKPEAMVEGCCCRRGRGGGECPAL